MHSYPSLVATPLALLHPQSEQPHQVVQVTTLAIRFVTDLRECSLMPHTVTADIEMEREEQVRVQGHMEVLRVEDRKTTTITMFPIYPVLTTIDVTDSSASR